jgi:competence protein ComEC
MLVDGGRYPSRLLTAIGDRLPFYDRDLELVVITHSDDFDTAALPALFSRYRAGAVLVNGQTTQSDTADALREAIAPFDVVEARTGYTVQLDDGVLLEVLHPPQQPEFGAPPGEGALLLRLSYGDVSFLLTSDLSRVAQRELLARGVWPLADVMQLPQHGTARSLSESFLDAVQPQVVVLQSDPANRRGDPDTSTLALLDASLPLFRTDEQGALHLWTDGQTLWMLPEENTATPESPAEISVTATPDSR